MFGSVPVVDTVLTADQLAALRQSSREDVYQFITDDLDYAISVLPVSYTSAYAGRITSFTARALKAKAMLYYGVRLTATDFIRLNSNIKYQTELKIS